MQELERRFNVPLVQRVGKRLYLTDAGTKLMEHARQLLDEDARANAAMRRFTGEGVEHVRVGTSMTVLMYLLPPTLRQLRTEHPQIEITLKAGLTTATLQLLKANALDLGICALPVKDPVFEINPAVRRRVARDLPATFGAVPKKVTPDFMVRHPLIPRQ